MWVVAALKLVTGEGTKLVLVSEVDEDQKVQALMHDRTWEDERPCDGDGSQGGGKQTQTSTALHPGEV